MVNTRSLSVPPTKFLKSPSPLPGTSNMTVLKKGQNSVRKTTSKPIVGTIAEEKGKGPKTVKGAPTKTKEKKSELPKTNQFKNVQTEGQNAEIDKPASCPKTNMQTPNNAELDTNILSQANKYFETDEPIILKVIEDSDGTTTDAADHTQQIADINTILHDPADQLLREEVMALCKAPEIAKKRHQATEKAIRAIEYAKVVMIRSTRTPAAIRREVNKMMEVITNSLMELEANLHHAEAKAEVLEHITDNLKSNPPDCQQTQNANRATNEETYEEDETPTKAPVNLARAIRSATSTIIVKGSQDRDPHEVEQQVLEATQQHQSNVTQVRRIRNGVSIRCENATHAQALKTTLTADENASTTLDIREASLKKKKLMIFNIPEQITHQDIKLKLVKLLGIFGNSFDSNLVQLSTFRQGRSRHNHCPVTLPEALASHLLQKKVICLGMKNCPVKNFITIIRCHRCQGLDHMANECPNNMRCSICSGEHSYQQCPGKRECCALCVAYNTQARPTAPKDTQHTVNSGSCWVYGTLLQIRQIEMDLGKKNLTKGIEVVKGQVTIRTFGKTVSIFRTGKNDETQKVNNKSKQSRNYRR